MSKPEAVCKFCNGIGYICRVCGNPAGECVCEYGSDEVECEECKVWKEKSK